MAERITSTERRCRGRPQLRPDDETRQIIYQAARHEFAASGYAATSTETVARRAGISTKTLYRLIPNKAALFEAMVASRLDGLLLDVNLQAADDVDFETALNAALLACANLSLDPEVVALQRIVLQEANQFSDLAATFYRNGIARLIAALSGWLRGSDRARADQARRSGRNRRHADRHGRLGAAAGRDLWRHAAALAVRDRAAGQDLREPVPARLSRLEKSVRSRRRAPRDTPETRSFSSRSSRAKSHASWPSVARHT